MQPRSLVPEPHEAEKAAAERAQRTRLVTIAAVLALLVLAGVLALALALRAEEAREFDAAAFRAADASSDYERMERESFNAARSRVLLGMPVARVAATLGQPHRVERGHWVWDVGMINDTLGPGDAGMFVVGFDPAGHVRTAEVVENF